MTTLARRFWTDAYPDELSVELEVNNDGAAFIVVTGQATYLTPSQAHEVASFVEFLSQQAEIINNFVREDRPTFNVTDNVSVLNPAAVGLVTFAKQDEQED